jgi:hypothetical protein
MGVRYVAPGITKPRMNLSVVSGLIRSNLDPPHKMASMPSTMAYYPVKLACSRKALLFLELTKAII